MLLNSNHTISNFISILFCVINSNSSTEETSLKQDYKAIVVAWVIVCSFCEVDKTRN